ncbi:hypothetical protein F0U44_16255 [Nocardioides humilatus]|uniref:Uncharacterized protein n=1 Tax=Nocardioides humilatus TaxID=2607660 RepID=A0A5B1LAD6_9ACTN|nr:hypothetical protein [Nocardioides humilatus]KAA1416750.1 hypothetical protein F0U44_16255 [Nocardioides humilatus]
MTSRSLEMPHRPTRAKRSKLPRILTIVGIVLLAIGWVVWYLKTPDGLTTSSETAEGGGAVGQDVYVGMWAVSDEFDRTIHIDKIEVDVDSDADVSVEAKVCSGGTVSVTTDASPFCTSLVDAKDVDFTEGDSIVLVVSASAPTTVHIGQLEVSYHDGIRWATSEAGIEGATLTFAQGTPGEVDQGDINTPTDRPEQDPDADSDDDKDDGDATNDAPSDAPSDVVPSETTSETDDGGSGTSL